MIDCEFCGGRHRESSAIERCRAKAERAAARANKVEAEILRRQRILDKLPVQEFVRERRAAGGAGGTWERIASALNKDYPERNLQFVKGEKPLILPYTVWEAISEYVKTLGWPCPDEIAIEMLAEKHMTGEYLTVHPLQLPEVEAALYVDGVITPEQLRLATGQDVKLEEEVEDDSDS